MPRWRSLVSSFEIGCVAVLKSLADLDAAYPPATARHDALPNQIATALVGVIGIIAGIVTGIKTEAKTAAAKAAATETAAANAVTATAVTTTTAAAVTSAMGKDWRAGGTQQERRGAEHADGIDAKQNHRRQTADQDVAVQFFVQR